MKKFLKIGIFLVFLAGFIWSLGIRIHPEVLLNYFSSRNKEYYRLELANGNALTGELTAKTKMGIIFKSQDISMNFANAEIAKLIPIGQNASPNEAAFQSEKSLFTFVPEKNLWVRFLGPLLQNPDPQQCIRSSPFKFLLPTVPVNSYGYARSVLRRANALRKENP